MSEHHHNHDHHHHENPSPEEAKALLSYMTDHNRHHVEELLELSAALPEEIRAMVQEAAETLGKGTDQLQKALEQLEETSHVSV
jgi:phytoene/squalene synthetase